MLDLKTETDKFFSKDEAAYKNLQAMIKGGFSKFDTIKLSNGEELRCSAPSPEFRIVQSKFDNLTLTWESAERFLSLQEPDMAKKTVVTMLDDVATLHDKYDRSPNLDQTSKQAFVDTLKKAFNVLMNVYKFEEPATAFVDLTKKVVDNMVVSTPSAHKSDDVNTEFLAAMTTYVKAKLHSNTDAMDRWQIYENATNPKDDFIKHAVACLNKLLNPANAASQIEKPKPTIQMQDSKSLADSITSILNSR